MNFKAKTIVIVLLVFSACSLFASDPLVSRTFKLTHTITVDSRFDFYFKSTEGQNPEITSVEITTSPYRFARFGISLNWKVAFTSILLEFNPLEHKTEENAYLDYTISIVEPHNDTQLVSTTPKAEGHGSCSAQFVESGSVLEFVKTINATRQDIDIADLIITIDDTNAMAGQYQGTIVCSFSVR